MKYCRRPYTRSPLLLQAREAVLRQISAEVVVANAEVYGE